LGGLAIDTALAFGESEVGLVLEPSLVQASAEGLVIGFTSVVVPGETADCVDLAYETEISTADWPMFSETADGSTLAYDIGFFIGRSFVDEVLQEIWAAGGLCMEVADLSGVPLGTSLMSGFVGDEFAALFPDNEASVLSIVPTAPPTIGFEDDGAPLRLLLDNLGMVYYAGLDHRMAGIFEVGITVEAGLDISLTSEELATALVLDPTAMDFEERWSELLGPGYSDGLADNLPSLVEAILPEDLLPTMAMPSILGIEIDTVIWQPTTDGEWQAGYLMLDTSKVEAIEISGCGIDALGCGGESSGVEFDLGEALGCSSDDALGCDEASSDCSSGCSASGRLSIPFARFGLLGLLGLGVLRRRRK
jgi:MYXO-CTERM domain-containing protein